MPSFVPLAEAESRLAELLEQMLPGEEIVITVNDQPIATLTREQPPLTEPRKPGSAKDILQIVTDDKSHLEDFKEYME